MRLSGVDLRAALEETRVFKHDAEEANNRAHILEVAKVHIAVEEACIGGLRFRPV